MQFERSGTSFYPLVDSQGRAYDERPNGYISFSHVSQHVLGIEGQYGYRYIAGEIKGYPSLGKDLRFNGLDTSGHTHHAVGIHPDDIEDFQRRYEAYKAYETEAVVDNNGHLVPLDQAALHSLSEYLTQIGAFEPDHK